MKHLKMLGLAAAAVMGLMAFVGAGTASATTLCTDGAQTTAYGVGAEIHMTLKTGTSLILKDTSGNLLDTAEGSTIKSNIEGSNTGSSVGGRIATLTWSGVSQTTDTINPGSLSILWTSGTSGTVVGKEIAVTLGIFGTSCTYGTGTGTTLGTITGGTAPELSINASLAKSAGGFLCPSTGIWEAKYIVTAPHAVFVGS